MEREVARRTINDFSAGNENLRVIMGSVYLLCEDMISNWPETATRRLINRVSLASSNLIGKRINTEELLSLKGEFWNTDNGKQVNLALENYLEKLKLRKEKLEGENRLVEI